jgi:hypothetical protein
MRLEVAPITDASSLAHVSPSQLVSLMKHRAPLLAARVRLPGTPTLEQLAEIIRSVQPEDEADAFLEDLHLIARICANESAEDLLLGKGVSLLNVSLGDALARAAIARRDAFEAIGDHATVVAASKGSTFTLFSPKGGADLEITAANASVVRARCSSFFGELGQGSHCDVRFYVEHDETGFLIDHAGARRTERLINEREKPEVRQYRPFRHDVVLLQRKTGKLRILARSETERVFYANLVGELLVGRSDYFVPQEAYVLDAIGDPDYGTVLTGLVDADIERVTLRELRMIGEDDLTTRHVLASNNVLASLQTSGLPLDSYVTQLATFSIVPRVRKGRRCYRLTVWKGNRVKCDAPWNDRVVHDFIARLRLRREAA